MIKNSNPIILKEVNWHSLKKNGDPKITIDNFIEMLNTYCITIELNKESNRPEIIGFNNCENDTYKQFCVLRSLCFANDFNIGRNRLKEFIEYLAFYNN